MSTSGMSSSGGGSNRTKWIVVGVVAVLIIAGVTALIVLSVPNVTLAGVNLHVQGPSSGACATTLTVPTGPYVYLHSSATYTLVTKFSNSGPAGSLCSVASIMTNTSGWSTVSSSTPAPVLVCGGGSGAFSISFRTPSGPYYGALTLEANATYFASNPACTA